jgi:hypothetical protein
MQRERMSKQKLLASLPTDNTPGTTHYAVPHTAPTISVPWLDDDSHGRIISAAGASTTGSAVFTTTDGVTLVLPPFPIEAPLAMDNIDLKPLVALLGRPRAYAAFLLRRGGYTTGFFRGDALVTSKTGGRFVKNRHRAGGQSQGRYDRIRDKQVHELLGKACEDMRATLSPYEKEIEHVFVGGDRLLLIEFHKHCSYFERLGSRIMPQTIPITGDPRRASLDLVSREVTSSTVFRWQRALQ